MSRGKTIALVAGMWLMGLALLAAFAWAVQIRVSTPVEPALDVASIDPVGVDPIALVAAGAAASATTAAASLDGWPESEGMHALEAAHRATQVGHANASAPADQHFAAAEKLLHSAMEAIHDGRFTKAQGQVRAAIDNLEEAIPAASSRPPGVPPPVVIGDYEGTQLINVNGSRIGRIDEIRVVDGVPVVTLQVGGVYDDIAKVLQWGGNHVKVPADQLLYGPRRSLGYVWVMVLTTRTDPDAVVTALAASSS